MSRLPDAHSRMTNVSGESVIELMVVMFIVGTLLGIGLPLLFGNYLELAGWLPYAFTLLAGIGVTLFFGVFNRNIPLALYLFAIALAAASFFIIAGLYPPLYIVAIILIALYNIFYKWIDRIWRNRATGRKRR